MCVCVCLYAAYVFIDSIMEKKNISFKIIQLYKILCLYDITEYL